MTDAARLPSIVGAACACVAASLILSAGPSAQAAAQRAGRASLHYAVKDLGTLGGSAAAGNSINNLRWVSGESSIAGDGAQHATLWLHGLQFDLGTPGGLNSAIDWPVKNDHGLLAGNGEISTSDPLGENFCRYGTGLECRGFVWQDGVMTTLAPFTGGDNSYAAGANNRGLVVGWAENGTHDATCTPPQQLQYEAVLWSPSFNATMLPPLPEDSDGAAVAVNNLEQVVGISGTCADADGEGAAHAVLWQNGVAMDLGNFGGTILNTADAINDNGQVVGFSTLPGNASFHAFLWTATSGIEDLGTLPGDVFSEALDINSAGQIVGGSCDASFNCRAFIWQNGVMTDLNTLTPRLSPLYLNWAGSIDEQGAIGGLAFDQRTGIAPAYMAVPHETSGDSRDQSKPSRRLALPARIRAMLRDLALHRIGPQTQARR
jgi:probable HAF family extracellular repeat protein